jgi:hypothetical protein
MPLACFLLPIRHTCKCADMLQVLAAKYPETLKAIQRALESEASLVPLLH